ncbi:MAG: J domain-containing protein [Haloarculaceae archaeon]
MAGESFYDVLGVAEDATTDEIRTAYRERLKETHPDVSDDPGATAATERIIEARDVLVDADERERYDRLGHEAYVAATEGVATGEDDASAAARAAREAGWNGGESGRREGHVDRDERAGPTNDRTGARERRRRERRARDRVAGERGRDDGGRPGDRERREDGGARTGNAGTHDTASGSAGTGNAASGSPGSRNAGTGSPWVPEDGFDVGDAYEANLLSSRLFPRGESLSLLVVTFIFYPILLFSTLFPPFPLAVNALVGVCTILVIAYLQSIPEAGVVVFGLWSVLAPVGLTVLGLSPFSLFGVATLLGTWLPFGLSFLTYSVVRP